MTLRNATSEKHAILSLYVGPPMTSPMQMVRISEQKYSQTIYFAIEMNEWTIFKQAAVLSFYYRNILKHSS